MVTSEDNQPASYDDALMHANEERVIADLFLDTIVDAPVKDDQPLMSHPFFSLSKRKRTAPIVYDDGNGNRIEITPGPNGIATIWDKDILMYAVSLVVDRHFKDGGFNVSYSGLETLEFSDGTTFNIDAMQLGTSSADYLYGTSSDNIIFAYGGDDYIYAYGGNDTLYGGAGDDQYVFNVGDDENTIIDESGTDDFISLGSGITADEIIFTQVGDDAVITFADTATDKITIVGHYDGTGTTQIEKLVLYDSSEVFIPEIVEGTSGSDTLNGGTGVDLIKGFDSYDHITGNEGDDRLEGGAGDDRYYYSDGDGNDTIFNESGSDRLVFDSTVTVENVELSQIGNNLLINIVGTANAATITIEDYFDGHRIIYIDFDDGSSIITKPEFEAGTSSGETITNSANDSRLIDGQGGADTINGGSSSETILGGGGDDILFGNGWLDRLFGGAGDDTLDGGNYEDYLYGGTGTDTASYSNDTAGVTVNLTTGSATDGWNYSDTLVDIENVQGSDHADTITGDSGDNVLDGGSGNDTIVGGAGNDTLKGGGGVDSLTGGTGDDTLEGNSEDDAYYFNVGDGEDTITEVGGNQDIIYLGAGITGVTQTVVGDDLELTFTGGSAGDKIILTDQDGSDDDLKVEKIILDDDSEIVLRVVLNSINGTSGADTLNGTTGGDFISGFAGNDLVTGNEGDDRLEGGSGNDYYYYSDGDGDDTIYEDTSGSDRLYFDSTITVDNLELSQSGNDLIFDISGSGIDTAQITIEDHFLGNDVKQIRFDDGSFFNTHNTFTEGTSSGETINGPNSFTFIDAKGGNDTVNTGTKGSYVLGGDGDDTLIGNSKWDWLFAGDGDDTLQGNEDPDRLYGGSGIDTADYSSDIAGATINLTSGSATDGWGDTDILSSIENVIGSGYADTITGSSDDNELKGGAGDDDLYGKDGLDTLYGEGGADTFYLESASAFNDVDVVKDFDTATDADVLDLSDVLSGFYNSGTDTLTDFVEITTSGSDSIVKVDTGGTATFGAGTQIVTLEGITGLTDEAAMVSNGYLVVE